MGSYIKLNPCNVWCDYGRGMKLA